MHSYCKMLTNFVFFSLLILCNGFFNFFKGNNSIELDSFYRQNMKNVHKMKVRYIIIAETIWNNFDEIFEWVYSSHSVLLTKVIPNKFRNLLVFIYEQISPHKKSLKYFFCTRNLQTRRICTFIIYKYSL